MDAALGEFISGLFSEEFEQEKPEELPYYEVRWTVNGVLRTMTVRAEDPDQAVRCYGGYGIAVPHAIQAAKPEPKITNLVSIREVEVRS